MPPKVKSPKSDFLQCDACGVIVTSKDSALHERVCSRCKFEGGNLEHDFIHDGVLHGTLQDYSGDETLTVPEWMKSQLLYLHPSCMKMCSTGIKDIVEVSQGGQTHLLIVWPSTNVGLTCVAMSKRYRTSKSKAVTVKRHCSSVVAARSVTVISTGDAVKESDASLQKCLLQQNMGMFTKPGSSLQCCFYGQIVNFEVIETQGEDGSLLNSTSRPLSSDNDESLDESMRRLAIHEELSGDHSFKATSMSPRSRTPKRNASWSVHSPLAFSTPKSLLHRQCESEKVAFHRIRSSTEIIIKSAAEKDSERPTSASYDLIGGLDKEIQQLRELFEVPIKHPGTFTRFGLKPPRGALLFGPPGTGKTMLARAVAAESKAALVVIDGPQIFSKYYGETEATLRSLFKDAAERAPSIVFIDEIDALCPKRESGTSNQEARAVATLVSLIDSLPLIEDKWVLVLGATNRPNFVDPSLRQPGRLDREIEIGVPTAPGRQQILQKILSNVNHSLSNEDITEIADVAHGLTGADLAAVCADAALRALERNIASKNASDAALSKVVQLTKADMATALRHTKPSAMREVALEIPKVRWSDIGGMKEVKLKLQQVVEWPWKHRDAFIRLGVTPPCGVLLYGPPGCSKTMIAKALATESGLNFIAIKGPELFSKWVGDSERAVRDLFRKARAASPCIIFFDEIDALAVHRGSTSGSSNVGDRVIAQLLTEMDGIEKLEDVILVAATNRPDMIDQALMRPGRLDSIVYVPLPDFDTRKEILHLNLSKKPLGDDVDIEALASKTSGYSGAEVVAVCQEAALLALEEDIDATCIEGRHLEVALKLIQPRISPESVQFYESYWASSQNRHTSRESRVPCSSLHLGGRETTGKFL
ncbi:ATPase family gene 2 protein homolog A isoform X1 [Rhipicephalus microplus]|uniref:ATPase family gene 2 protein homolog A isoform X1 n=1 Tax=Rhipicephalus microplus TaxID=6941 RepID=UPI003F6C8213